MRQASAGVVERRQRIAQPALAAFRKLVWRLQNPRLLAVKARLAQANAPAVRAQIFVTKPFSTGC